MIARALVLLAGLGGAWAWMRSRGSVFEVEQAPTWDPATMATNAVEEVEKVMDATTDETGVSRDEFTQRNRRAFLAMIRQAEGTWGDDGYRMMFGGKLFDGWHDHPRVAHQFKDKEGRTLWTSAAGAYQFMAVSPIPTGGSTKVNTWDRVRAALDLPDFGPQSQDRAALYLIDEAGALRDVDAGRIPEAISKVRKIWASLPGAGYAQPERSLDSLLAFYAREGGDRA